MTDLVESHAYRVDRDGRMPWDAAAVRFFEDCGSVYHPDGSITLFGMKSAQETSSGGTMPGSAPRSPRAVSMGAIMARGDESATAISQPTSLARPASEIAAAEPRGGAPSWRTGLGTSIVLHGAVVFVVVFGLARLASPDRASDSAMTVELAAQVSAPPAPPRQTPMGPQQVEAVVKPRPIDAPKIPPPPQLKVPVKPDVVIPIKPNPQPDAPVQKQAADETTAPPAIAAPPKPDTAAPTAGATLVASNAPPTWESSLLAKLERNKRYPIAAQSQHQEDVVYVHLVINSAGRLTGANIVQSRGFSLLDNEVISLVRRSNPFPAPPPADGNPVEVVVPVEFFITSHRQ